MHDVRCGHKLWFMIPPVSHCLNITVNKTQTEQWRLNDLAKYLVLCENETRILQCCFRFPLSINYLQFKLWLLHVFNRLNYMTLNNGMTWMNWKGHWSLGLILSTVTVLSCRECGKPWKGRTVCTLGSTPRTAQVWSNSTSSTALLHWGLYVWEEAFIPWQMTYLRFMNHHLELDAELISGSLLQMADIL